VPCDFLASVETHNPIGEHHTLLLANYLAQTEALMQGRGESEARAELEAPASRARSWLRSCPTRFFRNRPAIRCSTRSWIRAPWQVDRALRAQDLCPRIVWNVNSFDQWGVELGRSWPAPSCPSCARPARCPRTTRRPMACSTRSSDAAHARESSQPMSALTLARAQFALTVMVHYLYRCSPWASAWCWSLWPACACAGPTRSTTAWRASGPTSSAWSLPAAWPPAWSWNSSSVPTGPAIPASWATSLARRWRPSTHRVFSGVLVPQHPGLRRKARIRRMHWFATLMVALGATLSAFWIVAANSWQQTPAGFHIGARTRGADRLCRRRVQPVDALAFLARRAGLGGHGRGVRRLAQFALSCARPAPGVFPGAHCDWPRVWLALTGSGGRGGRCPHPSGCSHPAGEIRCHRGPVHTQTGAPWPWWASLCPKCFCPSCCRS